MCYGVKRGQKLWFAIRNSKSNDCGSLVGFNDNVLAD